MIPLLHIPLDFERREDVRKLSRLVGDPARGLICCLRMWTDWGTAGVEWRELKYAGQVASIDWAKEDLVFIIEEFCQFVADTPGRLIVYAITSGLLRIERRENKNGLVLNDFWRFNSHLSPAHKTIQQRGAIAKNVKKIAADSDAAAADQARLLGSQGKLVFDEKEADSEETKKAIALVMRLDRACGLNVRRGEEYIEQKAMMKTALGVVRGYSKGDVDHVCEYVMAHRDDPRLVKMSERLLEKFGDLLGKAKNGVA